MRRRARRNQTVRRRPIDAARRNGRHVAVIHCEAIVRRPKAKVAVGWAVQQLAAQHARNAARRERVVARLAAFRPWPLVHVALGVKCGQRRRRGGGVRRGNRGVWLKMEVGHLTLGVWAELAETRPAEQHSVGGHPKVLRRDEHDALAGVHIVLQAGRGPAGRRSASRKRRHVVRCQHHVRRESDGDLLQQHIRLVPRQQVKLVVEVDD
mmetsp:Transcript_5992/g.18468  ORF Transcript_5992/g.18468 Transcript_5992/m.18468 type:complete len:209 (-) Transcript_5992:1261-1887(-)